MGDEAYAGMPLYEAVPPAFVEPFPRTLRRAGWYVTNNAKTDYQFKAPADTWDASSGKAQYTNRPDGAPFFAVYNHAGTHESQAFPNAKRRAPAVALEDVPRPHLSGHARRARRDEAHLRQHRRHGPRSRAARQARGGGLADSTVAFAVSDHGVLLRAASARSTGRGRASAPRPRRPGPLARGTRTGHPDRAARQLRRLRQTVLSLAGVEPDQRLDGRAFLGEHEAAPRDVVFFQRGPLRSARSSARRNGWPLSRDRPPARDSPPHPERVPGASLDCRPLRSPGRRIRLLDEDAGAVAGGIHAAAVVEWYESLRRSMVSAGTSRRATTRRPDRTAVLVDLGVLLTTPISAALRPRTDRRRGRDGRRAPLAAGRRSADDGRARASSVRTAASPAPRRVGSSPSGWTGSGGPTTARRSPVART